MSASALIFYGRLCILRNHSGIVHEGGNAVRHGICFHPGARSKQAGLQDFAVPHFLSHFSKRMGTRPWIFLSSDPASQVMIAQVGTLFSGQLCPVPNAGEGKEFSVFLERSCRGSFVSPLFPFIIAVGEDQASFVSKGILKLGFFRKCLPFSR